MLVIEKNEMIRVLHSEHEFFRPFHRLHAHEKRANRGKTSSTSSSTQPRNGWHGPFLLLAQYGKDDQGQKVLAKVSQETLAETIGNDEIASESFHEQI